MATSADRPNKLAKHALRASTNANARGPHQESRQPCPDLNHRSAEWAHAWATPPALLDLPAHAPFPGGGS
eukprot:738047-Lingulodinium_polyedra.AAC.1